MEQQILICNEPSPATPSPTGTPTETTSIHHRASSTIATENSFDDHHKSLHQNLLLHSFDETDSPITSDSSGYDSNTSIISSNHSIDDGDSRGGCFNMVDLLPLQPQLHRLSQKRSRPEVDDHYDHYEFPEDQVVKTTSGGQSDQHLLDDNRRILERMLQAEQYYIPWMVNTKVYDCPDYEINQNQRHELTEWMFEVCEVLKCEEGLFTLSVNYLDRFLLSMPWLPKQQFQLVAIVCMLIASKIHQCQSLDTNYLSYATANTFTVKEILNWERIILKHLNWDVSSVVANDYLDYILVIVSKLLNDNRFESSITNQDGGYDLANDGQDEEQKMMALEDCWHYPTKRSKIDQHACRKFEHNQNPLTSADVGHENHGPSSYWHSRSSSTTPPTSSVSSIISKIRRHANTFITICSTELSFVCVRPSVIATACVAAAIRGLVVHSQQNHHHHQQQQPKPAKIPRQEIDSQSDNKKNRLLGPKATSTASVSSTEIPFTIYERFISIIGQQMNIDCNLIETHAQQIESLTVSKLNVQQNDLSSTMATATTSNDQNGASIVEQATATVTATTITSMVNVIDFPAENSNTNSTATFSKNNMINNNNNNNTMRKYSHELPATCLRSSTATPTLAKSLNGMVDDHHHHHPYNHQHHNHHHSNNRPNNNLRCHPQPPQQPLPPLQQPPKPQTTSQSQIYIHTTFAQVASAKQLLLINQQQQQQQHQLLPSQQPLIPNRFANTTTANNAAMQFHQNHIPSSRTSLFDTTNNSHMVNDGPSNNEHQKTSSQQQIMAGTEQQQPPPSILADLLAYLEQEDRENIPLFIMDPPLSNAMANNSTILDQENVPPQPITTNTANSNDTTIGNLQTSSPEDDDEGLEEDLYF